jgi:hypothetical protein
MHRRSRYWGLAASIEWEGMSDSHEDSAAVEPSSEGEHDEERGDWEHPSEGLLFVPCDAFCDSAEKAESGQEVKDDGIRTDPEKGFDERGFGLMVQPE